MVMIVGYIGALAVFLTADMVWLSVMASRVYRPVLGDMAAPSVNLPAAAVFYLLFPVGIVIFAVAPAIRSGSLASAALNGALFGFFAYATYDLTNQATLRNWTTQLTVIDITWGVALGALAASAGFLAASRFAAVA